MSAQHPQAGGALSSIGLSGSDSHRLLAFPAYCRVSDPPICVIVSPAGSACL